MSYDYLPNPNMKEQVFKTPDGHLATWSQLLGIKNAVLQSTGNEVTLPEALRLIDDCFNLK